ncbi:hypothetical protein [Halococcus sp. PRR34]|uniref:hypothetical protein n=1 Tax=Halococcus sp. PRR34 TaxID=3020830 RepID=UPI0023630E73|nr:hypothetical protein [Halococcus sp. PRR34]
MSDDSDVELLAAVSIPDTATLIGIYADGARVVGGRDEIDCSEHGRGECAHAEAFGGGVRVLDVDDIADEVAQSRAVQEQVLERVGGLDDTAFEAQEDGP